MKKSLKQFPLSNKDNCIMYLQHLVIATHKKLTVLKRYNIELQTYVENNIKKTEINPEIYIDFNNKIQGVDSHLLNTFADNTKSASSYLKFRRFIDNKRNRDTYNMPELPEHINLLLKECNNLRNWSLHVPESLLVAEMELSKEYEKEYGAEKLYDGIVRIPHFTMYSYDWLLSLSLSTNEKYEKYRIIHQQMKRDLSFLIGTNIRVAIKNYPCRDMEDMMISKESFQIQTGKRSTNNNS